MIYKPIIIGEITSEVASDYNWWLIVICNRYPNTTAHAA
jgi:hypothetical protein